MQSFLGGFWPRRRRVCTAARELVAASEMEVIDCGGGVRLLCQHAPPRTDRPRGIVMLFHGWEGSANSTYLLSAATRLWNEGYRIVRINLRDHGDSHELNEELFHSCRLEETISAVRSVQQKYPGEPLYLCGFSLGGNFTLRIAARADRDGLDLSGVMAVCPVLDPAGTMQALENGIFIYRRYFIQKWRNSLKKKKAAFPHRYNFTRLERFTSLAEMTDYFVRHYTGFTDLDEYLRGYSLTDGRLRQMGVSARILLAEDDPVIPVADIERVAVSDHVQVVRSRYGGHCGFIGSYDLQGWADGYIVDFLSGNHA